MKRSWIAALLLAGCATVQPISVPAPLSGQHEAVRLVGTIDVVVYDAQGNRKYEQTVPNNIPNTAETALRDCFGGTGTPVCTVIQNMKFHGIGSSSQAVAEGDTGCVTEFTTQYVTDNTRATGTQTNGGADIYRTVATNTVDATVTVNEFCLMSQAATGGGTVWTRALIGPVSLNASDTIQTTYNLTFN